MAPGSSPVSLAVGEAPIRAAVGKHAIRAEIHKITSPIQCSKVCSLGGVPEVGLRVEVVRGGPRRADGGRNGDTGNLSKRIVSVAILPSPEKDVTVQVSIEVAL